ncbi:MAG: transposase [Thiobacillaceae bacterium]
MVAAELSNNAADNDRLPVLLDAVEANLEAAPEQVLADAGFRSEAVFEHLHGGPLHWWSPWDAKAKQNSSSMRRNIRAAPRWRQNSRRRRVRPLTGNASGYRNRPTVGSGMY